MQEEAYFLEVLVFEEEDFFVFGADFSDFLEEEEISLPIIASVSSRVKSVASFQLLGIL
jgi:hypothetical protein